MIDKALDIIKSEVSKYIESVSPLDGNSAGKLKLSGLVNAEGGIQFDELGMILTGIEEERVGKSNQAYLRTGDLTVKVNPEIKLNLYVLFAANFAENYDESLKFISYVIRFFQSKQVFTPQNTVGMDEGIEKLIVELVSLPFEQQNYLWGMLGAKYMPSVLYKFRLLVVQEAVPLEISKPIHIIEDNYKHK